GARRAPPPPAARRSAIQRRQPGIGDFRQAALAQQPVGGARHLLRPGLVAIQHEIAVAQRPHPPAQHAAGILDGGHVVLHLGEAGQEGRTLPPLAGPAQHALGAALRVPGFDAEGAGQAVHLLARQQPAVELAAQLDGQGAPADLLAALVGGVQPVLILVHSRLILCVRVA
ncbi:hypothetical protein HMPREF0731_4569, partial [Pseudoroseomonas cervicalis ATCC 49957]